MRDLETIVNQELQAIAAACGPYFIAERVGGGYGLVQGGFQTLESATAAWDKLTKTTEAPLFVFRGTVYVLAFYPGKQEGV